MFFVKISLMLVQHTLNVNIYSDDDVLNCTKTKIIFAFIITM